MEISAASCHTWVGDRPVPPDWNGPLEVPYHPLPQHFGNNKLRLIEDLARASPHKLAIDDGSVRLTYSEVLDRVYGLVGRLQETLRPGSVVASLVPNSAAAPIITLAVYTAGLCLLSIDTGSPRERQAALFGESGAQAVIVQDGVPIDDGFIPAELPRIVIDPARATHAPPTAGAPLPDGAPVFIAFTSGSTGRPKGIAYGEAMLDNLRHFIDALHVNANDVILGLASLSSGGSRDAFAALCTGATIRIVDLKTHGIGEALRVMAGEGVTILSFVPTALRPLMQIEGVEKSFRNLRVLDLYGDRVLADDIALFRSKLPASCHIRVTLASIEVDAAFSWYVDDAKVEGPVVPVGYVAPGKQVALLSESGEPVPPGEAGELLVRGAIAIGGWHAGRLTPGPFIADPADPSMRIYGLGDLIRMRPDGLAEYAGRRDQRLKIRGLWADLGEVEAALRTVAGVADAVALPKRRAGEADRLVAFVVADEREPRPSVRALRRAVAAETAEHMAPSEIHFIDRIPRLASHKPDLVRLHALALGDSQSASIASIS